MSDIVNLNKARKARNHLKNRQQADENAVQFGRSKAERILDAANSDHMRRSLDRHKIEEEE